MGNLSAVTTSSALPPSLAAVVAAQGGVFRCRQALASGLSADEISRRLRSGEWLRLRRGIYAEAHAASLMDRQERCRLDLRALALTVSAPWCASHDTAMTVLGLPSLPGRAPTLHITRPDLRATRLEAGVHHHAASLPGDHVVTLDGLRVTSPARTALDVARTVDDDAGIVAMDAVLRRGIPRSELLAVHTYCRAWDGARRAGRLLPLADGRAESAGESLLRLRVVSRGLPPPDVQLVIVHGAFVARSDLGWRDRRTLLEFDGRIKYGVPDGTSAAAAGEIVWQEKRREDRLRDLGWEVVRATWADLYDPAPLMDRLSRASSVAAGGSPAEGTRAFGPALKGEHHP